MKKVRFYAGAILLVSVVSCKSKPKEVEEVSTYQITSPIVQDTSYLQEYVSQIQAVQDIEIRAKVKGYLESIHVDEGQQVKKGQLLFTIRPNEYEAQLMKAKAAVREATIEYQNTKVLADKNIVSASELAMSAAKLEEVKSEQALAELDLSYTKITAPFDGTIDRLKFKVGSLIDEAGLLTTLSNNKDVYAYFNVAEKDYLDFKEKFSGKNAAQVSLVLANGKMHKYKGKIETIEGEFDNSTGSIAFRAKFPNPELLLKHGETGKVQLTYSLPNAMLIPQRATYEIQDKNYVYFVDESGIVKSREIKVLQKLPNVYVIGAGLSLTDKFLLEGIQSVNDDEKVKTKFIDGKTALTQFK